MSLRDIFLFGVVAVLVPLILARPYIGALAWVMFGIMNPHRLTWGAAYNFPFAFVIAVVTLVALALTKQHREVKGGAPGLVLILFLVWICATAPFAFNPAEANSYLERVLKICLMTGVLMMLLHTRRQVELLVWTIVLSLGFYGVKGGVFTVVTGGHFMVRGPEDSVMQGNNALGVGLTVVIPLMMYLYQQHRQVWLRLGLLGAAILCAIAALGTYSRGAVLALLAMGCVLLYRSKHKMAVMLGVLAIALAAVPAMPEHWTQRMRTIQDYENDGSAMSRIVAWETAFNIAKDRFPIGGGLEWQGPATSAKYSPSPDIQAVAHSIYFQVIGSQGFVGLAFFLIFWMLVWRQCAWIRRNTHGDPNLRWAFALASMTQVSLVGYWVGGAFLDLAFWDLPYYLYAAIAITQYAVRQELALATQSAVAITSTQAITSQVMPPAGVETR